MNKLGYILLADDNENDLELTRRALAQYKVANEIIVVRDGVEALDFLYRRGDYSARGGANPLVILLDIKMPKVSGIEVLEVIKHDPELKMIPVVMLTSSRQGLDVEECYRFGANAYVMKPVDFQQFVEAVKSIGQFWAVINEVPRVLDKSAASGA